MQTFRIPESGVASARAVLGQLVHVIDGSHVVSPNSADVLGKRVKTLADLAQVDLDADRWNATSQRLHSVWAALVSEPLPDQVASEARLMLYADPRLELEFMGRGRISAERHLPAPQEFLVAFDIAGGRRVYLFRRIDQANQGRDDRIARVGERFGHWHAWANDPDARLVVSLGGGGFRLFAAIPVLKALERLVDRAKIAEVWGSSGGAFLGYCLAAGFSLASIDQFAFDLYNERVPHLVNGSVSSIVRSRVRAAWAAMRRRDVPPDMVDWLTELERRHPPSERKSPRPFYAIASSTERVGLTALGAAEHLAESCKDFMVACDPHLAVAASTAVPFLLRSVRGIGDDKEETWFDGSISDENPLALPYVKWVRERAARPNDVPPRLKILLVNLNLRAAESEFLRALAGLPIVRKLGVDQGSRLLDMLLDSKTTTNIRLVTATPGVEILSAKLNLGWLNAHDPRSIAKAMRSGRTLESWQIAIHGGTS